MKLLTFRPRSSVALSLLGLALAGGQVAQAQTAPVILSLTTPTPTTTVGSTVTLTVNLTGGTTVSGYNFNILLNPAQFQFIGTANTIFTNTDTATFSRLGSQLSGDGSDFNYTAGDLNDPNGINNVGPTALGTFQVKVLSALPLTGGNITFGPLGTSGGFSGTAVYGGASGTAQLLTATTGATLVTPAPEPSQTAALGLGVLGLAGLALRARRMKNSA